MAIAYGRWLDTYICPYIYIFHLKTFISAQSRFCSGLSRFSFSLFSPLLFLYLSLFPFFSFFLSLLHGNLTDFILCLRVSLCLYLSLSLSLSLSLCLCLSLTLSHCLALSHAAICQILFCVCVSVSLSLALSLSCSLSLLSLILFLSLPLTRQFARFYTVCACSIFYDLFYICLCVDKTGL